MTIDELVGKRALLKVTGKGSGRWYGAEPVEEYRVLEVSPSGNWVRLLNTNGNKFWRAVTEIALVEVLKVLEPAPKAEA